MGPSDCLALGFRPRQRLEQLSAVEGGPGWNAGEAPPDQGFAGFDHIAFTDAVASCPPAAITALAFQLVSDVQDGSVSEEGLLHLEELLRHALEQGITSMVCSGFPIFGALDWLADVIAGSGSDGLDGLSDRGSERGCVGVHADRFRAVLHHHTAEATGQRRGMRVSALQAVVKIY
ncbi:unnamed protein product [Symbiodinium natans]|uniref:Uncharacterized protein n=1 Tax=Symbiodinium natans TaxID=878477 RepID=A0A812GU33_9DINO|nr:unnamed protein product [Symbiodinium natans]